MSLAGDLHLASSSQALQPVLTDRLQHHETRFLPLLIQSQQALIDQGSYPIQHVCRHLTEILIETLHSFQCAAANKNREAPEETLLCGIQQIITPSEHVAQALLPRRNILWPTRQHCQAMLQPSQQSLRGKQVDARPCQFYGERQSVQADTNLRDRAAIDGCQSKIGPGSPCSLQEKGDRCIL